jgi:predicted ATPase
MLNTIHITGFKCIDTANLSLRPLTILAGPNASGKSSLIQAILLAYSVCQQKNQAYLKDVVKPYTHVEDVFCRFTNASTIEIQVEGSMHHLSLTMMEKLAKFKNTELEEGYEESLFYLGAHRTGPEEIAELNKELRIGQHGQYALGLLEQLSGW